MDKALVFGAKDCKFESCQGHGSRKHSAYRNRQRHAWGKDSATEWLVGQGQRDRVAKVMD